jgi:FAD/FMN-containing dehydrogenase
MEYDGNDARDTKRNSMTTRREFLKAAGMLAISPAASLPQSPQPAGFLVNDIHSQLNATRVADIVRPASLEIVQRTIERARRTRRGISVSGGRHAMGGQQFGRDTILLDTRPLNRVLSFDAQSGVVEVEAGIQWPQLVYQTIRAQGEAPQWGIAQKQTGADRLTLGGTLAANAHGRQLRMKPIVENVESFALVDAQGEVRKCNRTENAELFRLAIGGYGLFGIITIVKLRLAPRLKVRRVVEIRTMDGLIRAFEQRIADGFLYGDFQFSIDPASDDFLRRGVFSCYEPVPANTKLTQGEKQLGDNDWRALLYMAHANRGGAFERYAAYYRSTHGMVYWSDEHQLSIYPDHYHREIDRKLGGPRASEMITEIYVPRERLEHFLAEARDDFRKNHVGLVYGTIRLIERDDESFLAWAKQPYACTIFNLHTEHTPAGIERASGHFRRLIDMAIRRGGSYYLTYHRWAAREQVTECYPQFAEFLKLKRKHDPDERFQSEWYRHYRRMFADQL